MFYGVCDVQWTLFIFMTMLRLLPVGLASFGGKPGQLVVGFWIIFFATGLSEDSTVEFAEVSHSTLYDRSMLCWHGRVEQHIVWLKYAATAGLKLLPALMGRLVSWLSGYYTELLLLGCVVLCHRLTSSLSSLTFSSHSTRVTVGKSGCSSSDADVTKWQKPNYCNATPINVSSLRAFGTKKLIGV